MLSANFWTFNLIRSGAIMIKRFMWNCACLLQIYAYIQVSHYFISVWRVFSVICIVHLFAVIDTDANFRIDVCFWIGFLNIVFINWCLWIPILVKQHLSMILGITLDAISWFLVYEYYDYIVLYYEFRKHILLG